MKLGIIGSGKIVRMFLPALVRLDGLEIMGLLSTPRSLAQARQLCEQHGISTVTDSFEVLCATGIDTVYVAVPNHLHAFYCKMALEHGLHVIVEKPFASNDQEVRSLMELALEKDCLIFEAVTTLYLDCYRKIAQWLPQIGTVKLVQSQYTQYSSRYDDFCQGKLAPVFDVQKSGGALMDLNVYNLNFVIGLFGKPVDAIYQPNLDQEIDTSGMLLLRYPDFSAVCIAGKDCKGNAFSLIQGTDGLIRTDCPPGLICEAVLERNDGTREIYSSGDPGRCMIPEFRAFVQAVDTHDRTLWLRQMQTSLAVSETMTQARLNAGLRFPADEENPCSRKN